MPIIKYLNKLRNIKSIELLDVTNQTAGITNPSAVVNHYELGHSIDFANS